MERLLKSQNWTVVLVISVCLGLMVLALPRLPDRGCSMPIWALIVGEYLWVMAVLVCMQFKALRQSLSNLRLTPGFVSLGLIFLATAIGIIVSPIAKLGTDGTISLGLAQLTVMNLGALFLICAIINGERAPGTSNIVEGEDAHSATSANIKRLTQIRIKAVERTHENLASLKLPPELEALRESTLQGMEVPVDFAVKDKSLTQSPGVVSKSQQNLSQASNQAANKRTGSVSVDQLMQRLQRPAVRQAGDSATQERPVVSSKGDVQSPENSLPPEMKRLAKVQNKVVDANKPSNHTSVKLQGLSASGTGAANLLPSANSASGIEQTGLRSVLDRLDIPDEERQTVLESEGMKSEPVSSARDVAVNQITQQEAPSASGGATVFAQSVDKDMDDLFDKIAPVEAQREVGSAGRVMPEPGTEKAQRQEAAIEMPVIDEAAKVFKSKVDVQIEDIFAGLAPVEAQREVCSA